MASKPKKAAKSGAAKKPKAKPAPASKKKAAAATSAKASDKAKAADVMKMPSVGTVKGIHSDYSSLKSDSKQNGLDIADVMKDAKKRGVHTKAFKDAAALLTKDPKHLATYLAHRDFYEESLGVNARAGMEPSMLEHKPTPVGENAVDDEPDLRPPHLRQAEEAVDAAANGSKPH